MSKHKHAPRHNKIALTHDKESQTNKYSKKESTVRPPSRAWCLGNYYPLHQL